MPKCVTCDKMFHPDYSVIVDESNGACKCVFCYTGKDKVTIEDAADGKPDSVVTRREASEKYQEYLTRLSQDEKIRKAMHKGGKNAIQSMM